MSLSALGSILKNFWEPTSVDMRVILLVEGDTMGAYLRPYIDLGTLRVYMYMYTMVIDTSTRRWALTLPKFDEPFGPRFHFENFFWELTSVDVRLILLVEGDTMGECLHPYIDLETLRVYMYM
jgi:hypothetical protein